ncbi:single-stranded DNA-binding protein [Ileibacterium valens]|uniref:single-stranded DNA-binding protein n=1 Tax=Ileibacterium valens TaxID=1862668 RepID=UPI002570787C|nr:single-stranded DNA-binding protein [Ileibacterium valens]
MSLNRVLVGGRVCAEPDFKTNEAFPSALEIQIQTRLNKKHPDEIVSVVVLDDSLIDRALDEIEIGDFIIILGRIVTTDFERTLLTECPCCGDTKISKTHCEQTDIECENFTLLTWKQADDFKESVGLNKLFLVGNVCTPLKMIGATKNAVKFKLAVNKRIGKEKKADFPFLICYGPVRDFALNYIQQRSLISVEGSVVQRDIRQNYSYICPNCHRKVAVPVLNTVREVNVYGMDFMTTGEPGDRPMQSSERENQNSENTGSDL